jgi:trigger factor
MPVQVQQESIDHCKVALTIQVPPDEVQKAMDSVFNQVAKRTAVPGFRPGKAPRHLLKRFIDEERVRNLAVERAMTSAYNDAVKQSGVHPYRDADPQVELQEEELELEKGFSFKATVPLEPHVHLGDLEGLSARRVTTPITGEDVERQLRTYREAAARFQPTEEPSQEGDRIRTTMEVEVDGVPVPEASFTEPALFQIGANLPDLDAGLIGLKAGEEKTFTFTYPPDFDDADLRGKTATARVQPTEILRRALPELDDDFAKSVGMDNVEALRSRVRENLQAQADAMAESELDDNLIREVVRRSTAHYPDEMVEREVSSRLAALLAALQRRGLELDDYLNSVDKDLATLQEEMRAEAREAITRTLVMLEYARDNDIRVTDRDVEEEVKARAEAENVKPSQMRRHLNESGEGDTMRNRIFFRKVARSLREKAQVRDV